MATKPIARKSAKSAPGKPSNMAKKPATKTAANSMPRKPAASAAKSIDLGKLFGTVAKTLTQNQTQLNTADTYNHDHGDHMVQIFEVITLAMKEKQNASPADQLAYASQLLRAKSQSGSAQLYAEGLSDAASQFQGAKSIKLKTNKVSPLFKFTRAAYLVERLKNKDNTTHGFFTPRSKVFSDFR